MSQKPTRSFLRRGGRSPEERAAVDALRAAAKEVEARLITTIPHHHAMARAQHIAAHANAVMLRLRHGQTTPGTLPGAILLGFQALEDWRALLAAGWEDFDANAPPWAERLTSAIGPAAAPEGSKGSSEAIQQTSPRRIRPKASRRRDGE